MRNTFGNLFTLTTFGESHGIAVGGVIDGFPAGIDIDMTLSRASSTVVALAKVTSPQHERKQTR